MNAQQKARFLEILQLGRVIPTPFPVLMDDELVHTSDHPFCDDATCECHRDEELKMTWLINPLFAGEITFDEAVRIYSGK